MNTYILNSQANTTTKGNASILVCTLGCLFLSCTCVTGWIGGIAQWSGMMPQHRC